MYNIKQFINGFLTTDLNKSKFIKQFFIKVSFIYSSILVSGIQQSDSGMYCAVLNHVWLFETPWIAVHQPPLSRGIL